MKQRTPEPPEQRRSAYLDNGLAPPKLYRREQQQAASRQQRQAPPMTRQERRKKQNKRRRLKRSVRRALAVIGLVLLAVAIVAVLCLTVFFKIENITVTGSKVYDTEKVLSVCTIETGENLLRTRQPSSCSRHCRMCTAPRLSASCPAPFRFR